VSQVCYPLEIEAELSAYAGSFDASTLLGSEAAEVVRRAARIANLAAVIETKAAARVAETPIWKHQGSRTPAEWLARQTKCGVGEAIGMLETGEKLAECPKVAAKAKAGELTPSQTRALAKAVAADPAAEDRLLGVAERDGLKKLKEQCREVELASRGDAQARYDKIHRERSMRHWTDDDGSFPMSAKLTPDAGAKILGALAPFEKAAFDQARVDGRHEPHEAYLADALVDLARSSLTDHAEPTTGPEAAKPKSRKPSFTVLVDIEALLRGQAEPGETCEIPGVGAIPVSRLYDLAPEAFWHVLVTRGKDIRAYCAMSRYIPTMLKVALAARDRECAVAGCNRTEGLEIDHIIPVEACGPTTYTNLEQKCFHDHRENKHRRGLDLPTDPERGPP
jgi:Domain of unknown function (DUF222)/HNH endonuclease